MGSYTELCIAEYPLVSSKSYVIPEVMTVFRETDKRIFTSKISDRNPLIWGKLDSPEDDGPDTVIQYVCPVKKAIYRLNVMGFTLRRAREEFESSRCRKITEVASWSEHATLSDSLHFLEQLNFTNYLEGLREVISKGLRPWPFEESKDPDISPVSRYILTDSDEDAVLGFFCSDIRSLLRAACEVVDIESDLIQDISDVVFAGCYELNDPVCTKAIRELTSDYPASSPRIVLAEGLTDVAILREALKLLYPHLSGYYSFFDFESSKSAGGAGHLVSIIKAFAAAGISNRVIALFDNDTAAREARRSLNSIELPENIVVLNYPALDMLRSYPTIGPTGTTPFDVNGFAASIELYLGKDVLLQDGVIAPVQWRGFSESIGAYQGEVMHKAKLQDAFWNKLKRCQSSAEDLKQADWLGLDAILQSIFTAFDQPEDLGC
jgi:hypothetical protein